MPDVLPLLPLIFLGAVLYSSVGHGGATVYLAIFTLFHVATNPLVTTVLAMNVVAASIAWIVFRQAGHLQTRLLLPFVVTSVPLAYLGGLLPLTTRTTAIVLGLALLAGAVRLLFFSQIPTLNVAKEGAPFYGVALLLGGVLGFVAGATGIGGGIFLSPVIVAFGWGTVREAASVASAFIVLNSLAGLAAKLPTTPLETGVVVPLIATVVVGAFVGSFLGARRLPLRYVQVSLGLVLLVAAFKNLAS